MKLCSGRAGGSLPRLRRSELMWYIANAMGSGCSSRFIEGEQVYLVLMI